MNDPHNTDGWHFIGQHSVRFNPPDVFITRLVGDVSLEQNIEAQEWLQQIEVPAAGFYSMVDVAHIGRQDPQLMKSSDKVQPKQFCRAMIFYNARFHQRTLVNVFVRVAKVFDHPLAKTPIHMFGSEEEAHAWVDEDRKKTP